MILLCLSDLLCKQFASRLKTAHAASIENVPMIVRQARTTILTIRHDTAMYDGAYGILEVCESHGSLGKLLVHLTELVHRECRQTVGCRHLLVTLGACDRLDRLSKLMSLCSSVSLDHLLMLLPHVWELLSKCLLFTASTHVLLESRMLSEDSLDTLFDLLTELLGSSFVICHCVEVYTISGNTNELC